MFSVFSASVVIFAINGVRCISNRNLSGDIDQASLSLSNLAIQGRQYQPYSPYHPQYDEYPPYYQHYQPYQYHYGYRPEPPYQAPNIFKKSRESVMDALFSIAQNDDLQCVPKLLCEVTAGGLTGRQAGASFPMGVDLGSLTTFLSGLHSANMSPVLHFGKAALLGFAARGDTGSCRVAYPECPSDPEKLIKYLNNHNGGFFRFFQGLNTQQNQYHHQNYAQSFNRYASGFFGNGAAVAEKRIQTRPGLYADNSEGLNHNKYRGFSFGHNNVNDYVREMTKVAFPETDIRDNGLQQEENSLFKFPLETHDVPSRHGKRLKFLQSNDVDSLDIQRPLPNHVPSKNIFPDRTGTGELKLDSHDVESVYQESSPYEADHYNELLYDSFPSDNKMKSHRLSFPTQGSPNVIFSVK
ncbi:uncharacterized protein [Euwallacea fornicatus]|uniref:uncharacterized protein n=1 Tax=Euwallacea fornicatus TaxID=995702 RepID=UPI00338ECE28